MIYNTFVLSEKELSDYETTILFYAIAYNLSPVFQLTDDDIMGLSNMLSIDSTLLKTALREDIESVDTIQIGSFCIVLSEIGFLIKRESSHRIIKLESHDYNIFYMLFEVYKCYESIDNISDSPSIETVRSNLEYLQTIEHFFVSLNATIGSFENQKLPEFLFEYKYCMYDEIGSSQIDLIKYLEHLLICHTNNLDVEFCFTLCEIISYELKSRLTTINIVIILQVIKHSCVFNHNIKKMAEEMYDYSIDIFRNTRIISLKINSLYFDVNSDISNRTKQDNTTRIQILYGFSNYDDYEIRFDLAHGPVLYPHFNNISPGNNTASIFTKSRYEEIIQKHPDFINCFISYPADNVEEDLEPTNFVNRTDHVYALKERKNCNLSPEQTVIYDEICKRTDHAHIFSKNYSEKEIEHFISLITKMLPNKYYQPIDTIHKHAVNCFSFDKLIDAVGSLCLAYIYNNISIKQIDIQKIFKIIGEIAFNYNLIQASEINNIRSFSEINYILVSAKEQFGL